MVMCTEIIPASPHLALTHRAFAVIRTEYVHLHSQIREPQTDRSSSVFKESSKWRLGTACAGESGAELGMLSISTEPSKFFPPARFAGIGADMRCFTGLIKGY